MALFFSSSQMVEASGFSIFEGFHVGVSAAASFLGCGTDSNLKKICIEMRAELSNIEQECEN